MLRILLLICVSLSGLAAHADCDTYRLSEILRNGGQIEIDQSCSSYEARQLVAIGKERVIIRLKGFSAYDSRQLADAGATLLATAKDFSSYDMRQIADKAKHRLKVDLVGFSAYDARQIAGAGASFTLDHSFSAYDVRQICNAIVPPAVGEVMTSGFSDYDLRQITQAGCSLIRGGDDTKLSYYEARQILEGGGRLEIGDEYSSYETRQLAQTGKHRLTVRLKGFSAYDARQIALAGASFYVDASFSAYDTRQICQAKVSPANAWVFADGFSDYDLRQIASAGCQVVAK